MRIKDIVLFVDMDNTLALWCEKGMDNETIPRSKQKGFFENLPTNGNIGVYLLLKMLGIRTVILSACVDTPWCKQEKILWLRKHMPWVNSKDICLCNCSDDKATVAKAFLGRQIRETDLLLDDYGKNLRSWYAAGGTPIKKSRSEKKRNVYVVHDHREILGVLAKVKG